MVQEAIGSQPNARMLIIQGSMLLLVVLLIKLLESVKIVSAALKQQ